MSSFTGLPNVPFSLAPEVRVLLQALKDNMELLTGQKSALNANDVAILHGALSRIKTVPNSKITRTRATGAGFSISSVNLASQADYDLARQDLQTLIDDVVTLRDVVVTILNSLKGN